MSITDPSTVTTVAVVMAAYLGVLLVIGWRASRRTHGGEDFHLAGRSLGAWAAGVSSTANTPDRNASRRIRSISGVTPLPIWFIQRVCVLRSR